MQDLLFMTEGEPPEQLEKEELGVVGVKPARMEFEILAKIALLKRLTNCHLACHTSHTHSLTMYSKTKVKQC